MLPGPRPGQLRAVRDHRVLCSARCAQHRPLPGGSRIPLPHARQGWLGRSGDRGIHERRARRALRGGGAVASPRHRQAAAPAQPRTSVDGGRQVVRGGERLLALAQRTGACAGATAGRAHCIGSRRSCRVEGAEPPGIRAGPWKPVDPARFPNARHEPLGENRASRCAASHSLVPQHLNRAGHARGSGSLPLRPPRPPPRARALARNRDTPHARSPP